VAVDVLSPCSLSAQMITKTMWEVHVLYLASVHKYGDRSSGAWRFRYRISCRQTICNSSTIRHHDFGTVVQSYDLTRLAQSLRYSPEDLVERKIAAHSHCRTMLIYLVLQDACFAVIVCLQTLRGARIMMMIKQ
jgi:hypothetical protein